MSVDPLSQPAMNPPASAMLLSPDSEAMLDSHLDTMPAFQTGIQSAELQSEEVLGDSSMLSEDNPFRILSFYPRGAWKWIFNLVVAEQAKHMSGNDDQREGGLKTAVSSPVDGKKASKTKSSSKVEGGSMSRISVSFSRKPKVQANDSDSDGAPSRTSMSSAYSALARRGFKKVQKALAKRRGATSLTNLVALMRRDRAAEPDLLAPEDAPFVEQCPEPDYLEGMLVAPESPTTRPCRDSVSSGSEPGAGASAPVETDEADSRLSAQSWGSRSSFTACTLDALDRQSVPGDISGGSGQEGSGALPHSPRAPSVRFEDASDRCSVNGAGVDGTQPLGEGRLVQPHPPGSLAGGGEGAASQGGGASGDEELTQQKLRQIAEIMEGVGRRGRVSDGELRELVAAASARILLLTAPMDSHSRALVLEALRRRSCASGSPRAAASHRGPPSTDSEPQVLPGSWRPPSSRASADSAAGGDSHAGDPWPGPWQASGVRSGTAPAALQARRSEGLSPTDLAPLALTAPAGVWDEAGALERPPFRLLTAHAVPEVGTLRRPRQWSARARRVQSHACAADVDPAAEDPRAGGSVGRGEGDPVQQMVAASAMLSLAESFGVEDGGPVAADLMEALSSMEALVSAAAPTAASEHETQPQEQEGALPGWRRGANAAPGGLTGALPPGEAAALVQQSKLWGPSWHSDAQSPRTHSMPDADMHAQRASQRHSAGTGAPEAEGRAATAPLCNAHACMRAGDTGVYKGIIDMGRDELVLHSSGSERFSGGSGPRAADAGGTQRGARAAGAGYLSHAYTGTLDTVKDEFILDDDELESVS